MEKWEAHAQALHRIVPAYLAVLFGTVVAIAFLTGKLGGEAFLGPAGMAIGYFLRPQPSNGVPPAK